jgi:enterochelin esterase-like enzyme
MEASHLYKVESKLRMIEEERSIITSNLQIQINSLVEENENLKQQLSRKKLLDYYTPII